jgi:hypothetical protein
MHGKKRNSPSPTPLSPSGRKGSTLPVHSYVGYYRLMNEQVSKAFNSGKMPELNAYKGMKVFGKGFGETPFTKGVSPKGSSQ